jgi:hypothetical protein
MSRKETMHRPNKAMKERAAQSIHWTFISLRGWSVETSLLCAVGQSPGQQRVPRDYKQINERRTTSSETQGVDKFPNTNRLGEKWRHVTAEQIIKVLSLLCPNLSDDSKAFVNDGSTPVPIRFSDEETRLKPFIGHMETDVGSATILCRLVRLEKEMKGRLLQQDDLVTDKRCVRSQRTKCTNMEEISYQHQ